MEARAAGEARFGQPNGSTFGTNLTWDPGYELRWMAFGWPGGQNLIYHARNKSTGARFTNYFLEPTSQTLKGWVHHLN